MARDGVAVDSRLVAAVVAKARGDAVSVTAECAVLGVAPKTFYKYLRRFRAEGVEGFFPRSRAPLTHPTRFPAAVEDAAVRARKELDEDGADCGAISVRWRLEDDGVWPLPSRATVHRILLRRGQDAEGRIAEDVEDPVFVGQRHQELIEQSFPLSRRGFARFQRIDDQRHAAAE